MLLPIANCSMFCTHGVFHFLLLEKCKRYDPYVIVQDAGIRVDEKKNPRNLQDFFFLENKLF